MTTPTTNLAGACALVTGASGRLGRAIAERLGAAGADVVVNYRSDEAGARNVVEAIRAMGRRAEALHADLTDADACTGLAAAAEEGIGPLTVLVNNAAIFRRTPLETMGVQDFDDHMAANARPIHILSLSVGRMMKARGTGVIVNIADVAGLSPWAGFVPYSASKATVISLTRGFAKLLAPEVAPGPMLPPTGESPEQGERAVRSTLLGRWGEAQDVAEAVLYLATAPYVTGIVLPVDGGRHLA